MRATSRPIIVTGAVLGLILMILAGCGKSGGGGGGVSGPSADAPVISDLKVQPLDPEVAGRAVRYLIAVNFSDPQGDVLGGQCELTTLTQTVSGVITAAPGVDPNLKEGAVVCGVSVTAEAPGTLTVNLTIIDRAGHRSNTLSFALGLKLTRSDGAPAPEAVQPELRMDSATAKGR